MSAKPRAQFSIYLKTSRIFRQRPKPWKQKNKVWSVLIQSFHFIDLALAEEQAEKDEDEQEEQDEEQRPSDRDEQEHGGPADPVDEDRLANKEQENKDNGQGELTRNRMFDCQSCRYTFRWEQSQRQTPR